MNPVLAVDPERWRRIEILLDQALDLPSDERDVLLDTACAGDPGLRAEVELLLAADAEAGAFLGAPVGEYAPELLADASGEEEGEEDLAGHQLGPYRLLREIGGGGMGMVYEAEDTRLGRRVAVKLLPPEYSRDRRAKERFLREARAAAKVDHPNLCTVHDVGETDGRLYIILPLYEGETLRERLRRGPLPLAEARKVAIQVAQGLERAHEAGIVHRDIKPANVMLTRRGEVKILDFGIARLEGDAASITRTGASWGTPAYMSPEQARGEPVDGRTDLWSLGVMLYEMVAGRRPFGGESLEAVVSAILTKEPEPLGRVRPEVPPELARVVERALAKDPAERYASSAEVLADLEMRRARVRWPWKEKALRLSFAIGVLVALALVFALWRPWQAAAGPPLRVAVLRPDMSLQGNSSELAFVTDDILEAALATLVSLEGLQPLDPPEREEEEDSEAERLRAAEADEVLLPLIACQGDWCRVRFRRRTPGGEFLASTESFEVPSGIENSYQLAEGVRSQLQRLYRDHRLRPGSPEAKVRPQDYSKYIELARSADRGESFGDADLARLDDLLRSSPGLVGAYLLAAGIARNLGDFSRARIYAMRARTIAPYDPGPLFTRFRVEIEEGQLDAAQSVLTQWIDLSPGDVRVQSAEADLLESKGELKAAHRLRFEVAQRRPTWRKILELAILEWRLGESDDAGRRLEALLTAQPDNQYVQAALAMVEMTHGSLNSAAALYEELIRTQPARSHLSNLGFTRFLLGDYAAAAEAHRRALEMEPDHLLTRFNLATALEAQGELKEARKLYRVLADKFAALPTSDPRTRLLYAQCLARLGQRDDAARIADEVLEQRPEEIQVLNVAAQLYALLRDRVSARYYVKLACEKGLRREWFTIPEFRFLKEDPEFQVLLDSCSARDAAR